MRNASRSVLATKSSPDMASLLTLDPLKELVEELAKQQLEAYTATLRAFPVLRGKDVNDALWGTVSFTRMEVALLDSPLLQRLRYIRQSWCCTLGLLVTPFNTPTQTLTALWTGGRWTGNRGRRFFPVVKRNDVSTSDIVGFRQTLGTPSDHSRTYAKQWCTWHQSARPRLASYAHW